jgi:hypothetical protein
MGYRSQVTIVIYGDKDEVTAFVATERLKGIPKGMEYHPLFPKPIGEYCMFDIYDYGKGQTMMKWSWQEIKWYDSYPEIAYWETLASVWEDGYSNTSLCMELGRVGEQADDVEVNYYGEVDYCLSIHSEVSEDNMPQKVQTVLNNTKEQKDE